MRVLVAEDDAGLRDVIVLGLQESGYHVDAVERGDDAIDQLRWYEYDVAILDWRMPGAEGIDVVAWARKNGRPTAILMLTARDTPADRIQGLDRGADDYLVKPFDFGELLARVRALQSLPTDRDQQARAEFGLGEWLYTTGRTEAAARHFERAGELAPHDFTIRRGTMPMRGIDPMGPKFREMLGTWVQAGNPYYRPLAE